MIDPFTIAQTHPSLETRPPVQTHTMLEKTEATANVPDWFILTALRGQNVTHFKHHTQQARFAQVEHAFIKSPHRFKGRFLGKQETDAADGNVVDRQGKLLGRVFELNTAQIGLGHRQLQPEGVAPLQT